MNLHEALAIRDQRVRQEAYKEAYGSVVDAIYGAIAHVPADERNEDVVQAYLSLADTLKDAAKL